MAEFILETSYPSDGRTDEDEFCSIICLDISSGKRARETGKIAKI